MHATAGGLPFRDQPGLGGIGDVVDSQAAAEFLSLLSEPLMIDDHDAAGDAYLVRMPTLRDLEVGESARAVRIRHVDDRRPVRMAHVSDLERATVDPYLASAGTIEMPDQPGVQRIGHSSASHRPAVLSRPGF